jgi:hypothetical protein
MPKLWTFGCSHTLSEYNVDNDEQKWPNIVARHLNLDLVNLGMNGGSNDYIFEKIIENYEKIQTEDTVIVWLTYLNRIKFKHMNYSPNIAVHKKFYLSALQYPDFFENVAIKNVLAITALLSAFKNYYIFVIDPHVIDALTQKNIKFDHRRIFYFPNKQFSSFDFYPQHQGHLSIKGNAQAAEYVKLHLSD